MKILTVVLSLFTAAFFGGCVSNQQATIMPGADVGSLKSFYVVKLPADDRGTNKLISDELNARGYKASTGEAASAPVDVDATVTYQDKWMWDMTMYMIQLDIQFRNPKSDVPLATGECMFSSLIRKSPPDMVKETLNQIFNKAVPDKQAPAMSTK